MAKRTYTGVNSKARRVKRGSVGAANKARKIKRAYIGVGGVARPCWTGGEITYYGRIPDASRTIRDLGEGISSKNYAVYAGGESGTTAIDVYDANYTRYNPGGLSGSRRYVAGGGVGNYVLVAGGQIGTSSYSTANAVDVYDENLTKTTATALSNGKSWPHSATVGGYVIFQGGQTGTTYYSSGDAYNSELTRTALAASAARSEFHGSRSRNYAIFASGRSGQSSATNVVDAYDANLTHFNGETASVSGRSYGSAASTGRTALFGGGYTGTSTTRVNSVDAYGDDLTRMSAPALSNAVIFNSAARLGENAMFFGGSNGSGWTTNVDVYNDDLVKTSATPLQVAPTDSTYAATIGDDSVILPYSWTNTVYAYTLM